MKRFRFNLRTLFIGVALAAILLGYAQWRRQHIMNEARELESQGFTLLWQDTWTHWIWPVIPNEAKCKYFSTSDGNGKLARKFIVPQMKTQSMLTTREARIG